MITFEQHIKLYSHKDSQAGLRNYLSRLSPEKKIEVSRNLLSEGFARVVEVETVGKAVLSRMMSALIIGDFTSAYLGVLYGIDPSTTDSIASLKASIK